MHDQPLTGVSKSDQPPIQTVGDGIDCSDLLVAVTDFSWFKSVPSVKMIILSYMIPSHVNENEIDIHNLYFRK
jgi:hypothetical protein